MKKIFLLSLIPPIFVSLFWEFFKIGLFAVGGGFATIPFLYNLTHIYNVTVQDISDMVAVATVLPGPIGVSCGTFTGCKIAGIPGGLIAAAGLITPSVIVIIIVAKVFMQIKDNKHVQNIFYGLRAVVCGLIAACAFTFLKNGAFANNEVNWKILILFLVSVSMMIFVKKIKIHPIVYIISGALIGILFAF